MAGHHFLYLTAGGLHIAQAHRGQVSLAGRLDPIDGPSALTGWLQQHPRGRITLLADLPDESYHLETLPAVGRRDRRQLIARRRAQLRLDTPYITHQSLGPSASAPAGDKPGEKILFAALHRPATLQPWLAIFEQAGRALDGVGLIAHLAAEVATRLATTQPTGLPPTALLVWKTPAGLRVSCLEGGRLRFSRLTPGGAGGWQAWGDEIRRTHQYLIGQRAIERGQPTPVFVLAHPQDHAPLASALPDTGELQLQAVGLPELATRCGLRGALEDSDSLPLLLHLASRSRPQPRLTPPGQRPRHLPAPATTIGVIAAAVLAASLVIAAGCWVDARDLRQQAARRLAESLAEEAQARRLRDATPALPLPADTLGADFSRLVALQPFEKAPTTFLFQLARALDALPGVELASLEWSLNIEDPAPAVNVQIALQLPAAPRRHDLVKQVTATIHRHLGVAAPDAEGPLRSPDSTLDSGGRLTLDLTLPASLP